MGLDKLSNEDQNRLAEEIFDRDIRPKLVGEDENKFLAIDLETGNFEVDRDLLAAVDRLRARNPDAYAWVRRVGSPYAWRMPSVRFKKPFLV